MVRGESNDSVKRLYDGSRHRFQQYEAGYHRQQRQGVGVDTGVFADERDAVNKCTRLGLSNQPDMANHQRYQKLFEIYLESQKRLVDINHRLREFELA